VKNAYWALFDTDDLIAGGLQPGQRLVDVVQARIDRFAEQYGKLYPSAVRCLLTDREQLTSYLRFPTEHHRRIRHSNFIERTFGETRRRVKVIGRLPGETSCLSLVWAVLDRASRGWRGLTMTPQGLRLLQDLRRQLLDPPTPIRPPIHDAPNDHKTVGAVAYMHATRKPRPSIYTAPGTPPPYLETRRRSQSSAQAAPGRPRLMQKVVREADVDRSGDPLLYPSPP